MHTNFLHHQSVRDEKNLLSSVLAYESCDAPREVQVAANFAGLEQTDGPRVCLDERP